MNRVGVGHELARPHAEVGQLEWPTIGEEIITAPRLETLSDVTPDILELMPNNNRAQETIAVQAMIGQDGSERKTSRRKPPSRSVSRGSLRQSDETRCPVQAVPVVQAFPRVPDVQALQAQVIRPGPQRSNPVWPSWPAEGLHQRGTHRQSISCVF